MRPVVITLILSLLVGCGGNSGSDTTGTGGAPGDGATGSPASGHASGPYVSKLTEARRAFATKLVGEHRPGAPPVEPPADAPFVLVSYESPVGQLPAYITKDPGDGNQHPAIIWIVGGDTNTLEDRVWEPMPRDNDQMATAYRNAGIVMIFPGLRGGNNSPGRPEGFLGEVDDVIAAADYLAAQSYVDPDRIYLGGHSTGGTLALLTAESTDRFRSIFAFGAVGDISIYRGDFVYCNPRDKDELKVRSAQFWWKEIRRPTFLFGGRQDDGYALQNMKLSCTSKQVRIFTITRGNHFNVLAPINELIASRILEDTGPSPSISFTSSELDALVD